MLKLLRQSRLLALMLILITPGLAGNVLQAVHPCPTDAPWLSGADADATTASHHSPAAGHHEHAAVGGERAADTGGHAAHGGACHCLGSCQLAPAISGPDVSTLAVAPLVLRPAVLPARSTDAPVWRPADHLPPATAPPHA